MKTSQLAAALIAATALSPAALAAKGPAPSDNVRVCIPVWNYIDTETGTAAVEIVAQCDASALNKQFKLKLNELGCAIEDQNMYDSEDYQNGSVFKQAAIIVPKNEKPRDCSEGEMAAFWVEL